MIFVIISLIIGFLTAFIGSIAGLGGGVILIPSLLFLSDFFEAFSWVTPQKIVAISLIVMIFTGMSSALSYIRHKRVDFKLGSLFLIGSIPGGIFGAYINGFLNADVFSLIFGGVMIFVSLLFFLPRRQGSTPLFKKGMKGVRMVAGEEYHYTVPITLGLVLAFTVGTLSGLLGIGGGSLMVPAMILLFQLPPHIATATSMFMIFFAVIPSSVTHIGLGHVDWYRTLFFIPGAYLGGTVGAYVNRKMNAKSIEWVLRILLIVVGVRLISQGL
ncbi:sulfite exporter TauE/SafE family protein [Salimicrobium humidisoli]|uniref:Probable membrane transporter protein n=1 Tax=Salimicrobium humidisoli TaxID=2029857 RepID=A0ABX4HTQ0_9BACI|nr:sulfite exporter TauE/SafE family protein [Salimicrobium humidisoli]PBB06285.1 hypothetical protein CKW00_04450 [Salimicrobium humidisoli]